MADRRWKPIVFTATVIVAVTLIIFLIVHRSNNRTSLCDNDNELLYTDGQAGNDTGTCYPSNRQGPCQPNMILIPVLTNKSIGVCDCDNMNNERALVYHEQTNKCYFIFTQAYCSPSEWLILTTNTEQKCEPNRCLSNNNFQKPGSEWVPLKDGTCVELGKTHDTCKNSEVIQFFQYKIYPACSYVRRKINTDIAGVGVPPAECPKGYSRSQFGHCAVDFDFE